jgi:long-chain fatty acid transport protein
MKKYFVLLFFLNTPFYVYGNSFEDMWGAGARLKGMGSAGTAASEDFSAAYYNPANLGLCTQHQSVLEYTHVGYRLNIRNATTQISSEKLRPRDGVVLGACGVLPWRLRYGVLFGYGFQHPQYFSQASPTSQAVVALYGQRLEQLSIIAGLGARVWKGLYVGAGVSVLVNSTLQLDNRVPIYVPNASVYNAYAWDLEPRIAPYAGVSYVFNNRVRIGASYRGALFHTLKAYAQTGVNVTGVPIQLDMLLQSVAWYSPQQASLGVYVKPMQSLGVALDVTWYGWSSYQGPYVKASPMQEADTRLASALQYPVGAMQKFKDIVVPRMGLEYVLDKGFSARAGYSYRAAAVEKPKGYTNLLDQHTHVISTGAGYQTTFKVGDKTCSYNIHMHTTLGLVPAMKVQQENSFYRWGGYTWEAGLGVQIGY